ncbi:hypothetical protein HDV04_001914 [Boothiomyces sp. JEL0838]|nr:hypothetical protein HDV04_001889 [Boothiomyces sp. JEL0838]KAJ3313485.1 hypothetical protein HDV04_001914 [Boothiomyces sp. JEL0838]
MTQEIAKRYGVKCNQLIAKIAKDMWSKTAADIKAQFQKISFDLHRNHFIKTCTVSDKGVQEKSVKYTVDMSKINDLRQELMQQGERLIEVEIADDYFDTVVGNSLEMQIDQTMDKENPTPIEAEIEAEQSEDDVDENLKTLLLETNQTIEEANNLKKSIAQSKDIEYHIDDEDSNELVIDDSHMEEDIKVGTSGGKKKGPKKPLNAFILFKKAYTMDAVQRSGTKNNREIFKVLKDMWANASPEIKKKFQDKSFRIHKRFFIRNFTNKNQSTAYRLAKKYGVKLSEIEKIQQKLIEEEELGIDDEDSDYVDYEAAPGKGSFLQIPYKDYVQTRKEEEGAVEKKKPSRELRRASQKSYNEDDQLENLENVNLVENKLKSADNPVKGSPSSQRSLRDVEQRTLRQRDSLGKRRNAPEESERNNKRHRASIDTVELEESRTSNRSSPRSERETRSKRRSEVEGRKILPERQFEYKSVENLVETRPIQFDTSLSPSQLESSPNEKQLQYALPIISPPPDVKSIIFHPHTTLTLSYSVKNPKKLELYSTLSSFVPLFPDNIIVDKKRLLKDEIP